MAVRNLSYTGTAASASTTTICTIPTCENGVQRMGITVTNNDAAAALDAFVLSVRTGQSTVFHTIASAAGDFTSPVAPLVRAVGAPVTLAATASAFLLVDCYGLAEVRIAASGNAAACSVSVEVTLG
jgi:hypothetical protein